MTEILTWNIQCGLGIDGQVDLRRIVSVIKEMGDPDVICLQEVCRFMADLDGAGADQVEALTAGFPGMFPMFGAAVERRGQAGPGRASFGNLILTRLPVHQVFRHPLPQPPDTAVKHMPRQAIEATVETAAGPLRVVTTHLEFHSERQRLAQAARLRDLHAEITGNERRPGAQPDDGPYAPPPRPTNCVMCGDFNIVRDDPVYRRMTEPFADGTPQLLDAWAWYYPDTPHDPTCGIYDRDQWPQGAHCRDFFFVTPDLAERITDIKVDQITDASDHQPVLLRLDD